MMLQRCTNPNFSAYKFYGGRGIKVCERWATSANFLCDMGERPSGTTLERIDGNGNYEPGNCKWASHGEQMRNRRSSILLTHSGETLCLREWGTRVGLKKATILRRYHVGDRPPRLFRPLDHL